MSGSKMQQHHEAVQKMIIDALPNALALKSFPGCEVFHDSKSRPRLRKLGLTFEWYTVRADVWVINGSRPYPIEIGRLNADKWRHALPVAHVTFGASVAIYNALFTPFEQALCESLHAIVEVDRILYEEEREDAEDEGLVARSRFKAPATPTFEP
jgi:hypothetical protein